mmetsp:Transcript_29496/g.85343  ORF Transcript_29496/g.85343 Transcript_29496/m.85343 type:complete len:222 (+) Transcript_29496:1316-1981(+)
MGGARPHGPRAHAVHRPHAAHHAHKGNHAHLRFGGMAEETAAEDAVHPQEKGESVLLVAHLQDHIAASVCAAAEAPLRQDVPEGIVPRPWQKHRTDRHGEALRRWRWRRGGPRKPHGGAAGCVVSSPSSCASCAPSARHGGRAAHTRNERESRESQEHGLRPRARRSEGGPQSGGSCPRQTRQTLEAVSSVMMIILGVGVGVSIFPLFLSRATRCTDWSLS